LGVNVHENAGIELTLFARQDLSSIPAFRGSISEASLLLRFPDFYISFPRYTSRPRSRNLAVAIVGIVYSLFYSTILSMATGSIISNRLLFSTSARCQAPFQFDSVPRWKLVNLGPRVSKTFHRSDTTMKKLSSTSPGEDLGHPENRRVLISDSVSLLLVNLVVYSRDSLGFGLVRVPIILVSLCSQIKHPGS
jgi:hypothetical protein